MNRITCFFLATNSLLVLLLCFPTGCVSSSSQVNMNDSTASDREPATDGQYESIPFVSGAEFETLVLGSEIPVFLEFFTPWCGACRQIDPLLKRLAKEYSDRVKFFKINAVEEAQITKKYEVIYSPTFLIFRNGQGVERLVGSRFESQFRESLSKVLAE